MKSLWGDDVMSNESFLSKMLTIDRRILYWILVVLIVIPIIRPIGLPIPVSETTRKFYDTLKNLHDGSILVLDNSVGAIAWSEIGSALEAVTKFIASKNFRVIIWSTTNPECGSLTERYLLDIFKKAGKKYGEDYVLIGYVPGAVSALATLARDMHYPRKDFYGNDLDTLKIFEEVRTANDVAAVILAESGAEGAAYVTQWYAPYHVTILDVCTGALVSERMIAYNAGQIKGMIAGARGSAEIELLTGYLGTGISSADALSITHLYLIILIVIGNVAYLEERRSRRGR
jgi:hypothetical protein